MIFFSPYSLKVALTDLTKSLHSPKAHLISSYSLHFSLFLLSRISTRSVSRIAFFFFFYAPAVSIFIPNIFKPGRHLGIEIFAEVVREFSFVKLQFNAEISCPN